MVEETEAADCLPQKVATPPAQTRHYRVIVAVGRREEQDAATWQSRDHLRRHRVDPHPDDEPPFAADAGRDRARCDCRSGGGGGDPPSARPGTAGWAGHAGPPAVPV